jgi:hypothetical protein
MSERLVTIRRYPSEEDSEDDYQRLLDAGIPAYRGSWSRYPSLRTLLRVPESQVDAAIELLPPAPPDLFAPQEIPKVCPWCGSDRARYSGTVARILGFAGIFVAASLTVRRYFELALVGCCTVFAIWRANIGGDLVCGNCGREWRARGARIRT